MTVFRNYFPELVDAPASVDPEDLTGDVSGFVGAQEQGHLRVVVSGERSTAR